MPELKPLDDIKTYRKMADDAYKRGKSGYSVKDEKDAKAYKKVWKDQAIEVMGQTGSIVKDEKTAEDSVANAEDQWKHNTKSERGRQINQENMAFGVKELAEIQARRKARAGK